MKKALMLPLFAVAALVSQAWAEVCTGPSGANACEIGGGCYKYSTEYSNSEGVCEVGSCTCAQLVENCSTNGVWYSGVTGLDAAPYGEGWKCSEHGGTKVGGGNEPCGFYCKWATGCKEIKTDINGVNNPSPILTCTAAIAACDADASRYSNPSCTGDPVGGNNKTSLGCCKFATDPTGKCWDVYEAEKVTDCSGGENQFWPGACPDGQGTCPGGAPPTLIKFTPASLALVVAPFGRSLHISSAKDASVSLYDMSGAKVYSGKVRAGNSVFSLERVASGSYYAIVQSGSDSKKVPVVLK